jgi:hypothetical protein
MGTVDSLDLLAVSGLRTDHAVLHLLQLFHLEQLEPAMSDLLRRDAAALHRALVRVVLADANVLYSRVLRDYLLYAADQETIAIAWSSQILAEVTEHLERNVAGFDRAAGEGWYTR